MNDRVEMLEAALDLIDEGVAILDLRSNVLFWNKAAAALTGYLPYQVIAQRCPENLYCINEEHRVRMAASVDSCGRQKQPGAAYRVGQSESGCADQTALLEAQNDPGEDSGDPLECPTLVSFSHKFGHAIPGMLRKVSLRDSLGDPIGTVLFFYPVEEIDALPHGETRGGADIERSQADMEDRLEAAHHQWKTGGVPFGLLWITVDQADSLRRTHGHDACEAMLRTIEQTLLRQMKPAEVLGRWGNNEFLILTHERNAELLVEHARRLAGLARTADFRWWGDRVGLTVSIGAGHVIEGDSLQSLLSRARQAMRASAYAGGNQVTEARER